MKTLASIAALGAAAALYATPSVADSAPSTCEVYPKGEDHTDVVIPCVFSQRQGYITLRRDDGVVHELAPEGETVGNYTDQDGRPVYRQSGLGDQGLIFRFPDESVFVYWGQEALKPADPDNPTWPFTTADYDATTLLPCRKLDDSASGSCPAGITRMEGGQASITVKSLDDETFTINFMSDYTNAANREVEATLEGDTWTVVIDGEDEYIVPLAAIEGG